MISENAVRLVLPVVSTLGSARRRRLRDARAQGRRDQQMREGLETAALDDHDQVASLLRRQR
jgi:hypothetical protein